MVLALMGKGKAMVMKQKVRTTHLLAFAIDILCDLVVVVCAMGFVAMTAMEFKNWSDVFQAVLVMGIGFVIYRIVVRILYERKS